MQEWIDWLYDIFVTVVTFVFSLFGFDLSKRSVETAPSVSQPSESPSAVSDSPKEEHMEKVEPVAESEKPATESDEQLP